MLARRRLPGRLRAVLELDDPPPSDERTRRPTMRGVRGLRRDGRGENAVG